MGRPRQQEFAFRTWGGRRLGAGRRPHYGRPLVSHLARPPLASRYPVHVTLRIRAGLPNLRHPQCFYPVVGALRAGRERGGFRLVHYSVQTNHLHLVVEAADRRTLARGMQGLAVRIARAFNRATRRIGRVFFDHYHARILRTPTEVVRAVAYVRENARRHATRAGRARPDDYRDPCASPAPLVAPRTWLLTHAILV